MLHTSMIALLCLHSVLVGWWYTSWAHGRSQRVLVLSMHCVLMNGRCRSLLWHGMRLLPAVEMLPCCGFRRWRSLFWPCRLLV